MKGYTCIGPHSGECGRVHKTVKQAVACIRREHARCIRHGGWCDRYVMKADRTSIGPKDRLEAARLRRPI